MCSKSTALQHSHASQVKKYEEQHGSNKSTYWVTFELIWRDYFRCAASSPGGQSSRLCRLTLLLCTCMSTLVLLM